MLASDIGARSLTSAPENLEKAAQYIEHCFKSAGLGVSSQQFSVSTRDATQRKITDTGISFATITNSTRNIVAEVTGASAPEKVIVVGAHYDSVFDCPAANDNGSGVAAVLEIAKALANSKPAYTIRFIAFTNEEPPFFRTEDMGSYRYAQLCHQNGEDIVGMLSLETIGYYSDAPNSQKLPSVLMKPFYPSTGNFIGFVSNFKSRRLLNRCLASFRQSVKFPSQGTALPEAIAGVGYSDHESFWRFGYPAIMVTDTANYRYPHYHEASDTPDKVNYDCLSRVTSGLTETVRNLASRL